ncbi:MAG: helix-hairpin-helix domain-containing protein [Bacteroidales bacterium]|nr:helix-hairpin-helix domain-containing protein [Bacteroidales bacterium]
MKPKSPLMLRKSKQGILLLLGIGLGVIIILVILIFENSRTPIPISEKEILRAKKEKIVFEKNKSEVAKGERNTYHFKPFNPNTITKEELLSFGLSQKQASNFVNYTNAGGRFRTKQDLKKLYCMTEDLYNQISPYVLIETVSPKSYSSNSNTYSPNKFTSKEQLIFDLNQADTIDLQALRGIGASYSRRIFKYGQKLGGYGHF